MENNKAKWLLENLLARMATREDGKKELPGVITEAEQESLRKALYSLDDTYQDSFPEDPGNAGEHDLQAVELVHPEEGLEGSEIEADPPTDQDKEEDRSFSSSDQGRQKLSVEIPAYFEEPVSKDFRLCIDFGTAMSKVTLVHDGAGKDGGEEIQILKLGDFSGHEFSDDYPELLISSVYISDDGLVYFGSAALEVSLDEEDGKGGRRRIDNMKRFLSEDGLDNILMPEFNPTGVEVKYRDVMFFYLTYLTLVINRCLDDLGYDKNTCRRFAMPVFDSKKSKQYSSLLSRMLGDAQVAAEHFGDYIENGISLERLKKDCDVIREMELEYPFVGMSVTEPLGVASSLVSEDGDANNLSMVIDVGAGTTDISLFRIRVDSEKGSCVAKQIPGAARGLLKAGNHVDQVLLHTLLAKAKIEPGSFEYKRQLSKLGLKVRGYKEDLFENGVVEVLVSDDIVEVNKDEFLSSPSIKKFKEEIWGAVKESLEEVDDFYLRAAPRQELVLVLTGGGADLPFVRDLIGETFEVGNLSVKTVESYGFPEWMWEDHADLEDIFPRIAVSLGGARENVITPYSQQSRASAMA